ncbi:MAG: Spy/CpxP family protein refolding chaperone [Pyrinomonadaceae bacterium]
MKRLGRIKTLAAASLAAVALATPLAMAQTSMTEKDKGQESRAGRRGHGKHGGHRGGRMGGAMMFRGVNLTDEQKAQMKQIRQSFHERNKPLREQLRAKRQELRQAGEGGTFNEALATQKLTETAGLQAKLMGEQFKLRQEMLAVLTPEQKTLLEQKRAEFKAKRAERGARQSQ